MRLPALDARALTVRDEVAFFQAVRAAFEKRHAGFGQNVRRTWIRPFDPLVSKAIAAEGVVDLFAAMGRKHAGHLHSLGRVSGRGAGPAALCAFRSQLLEKVRERPDQGALTPERAWNRARSGSDSAQALIAYQNRTTRTGSPASSLT